MFFLRKSKKIISKNKLFIGKNIFRMIRHFFLDKTNTIIENSFQNLGLNPILHLGYGNGVIRGIVSFDISKIKDLVEDKTFADTGKIHCRLKMTNCFSVDGLPYEKTLFGNGYELMQRASSFDIIAFKLPKDFDEGRGYEFPTDMWVRNCRSNSIEGSNWYFCKNGIPWSGGTEVLDLTDETLTWRDVLLNKIGMVGGVYSKETLKNEYDKFLNGDESIIVAEQHFDFGNENLNLDITDAVMNSLDDGWFGLCLAFSPRYESMKTKVEQYVGFFNDNTNTYFHPYVEVIYDEYINDDRESFTVGRENRLYLYVSDNGNDTNLDNLPSCSVNGVDVEVKQATKGAYFAVVDANASSLEPVSIYEDIWSNIQLNGVAQDDVELEFSTRPKKHKTRIDDNSFRKNPLVPTLYGINNDENVIIGDIREITVDFRRQYSTDKMELVDNAEYRIYVKDGDREIDVFQYQPIEKAFLNNFFVVYTMDMIPNRYFVDIRVKRGRETKHFKDILHFNVVSDVTERYQ